MTSVLTYTPQALPKGSRCTRCRADIPAQDVADFIFNDHLCVDCRTEEDYVFAQRVIAAERQSTVPERSVA